MCCRGTVIRRATKRLIAREVTMAAATARAVNRVPKNSPIHAG